MAKFKDLTPSAKKAYQRHLQTVDKLFKRGKETGKVDPNSQLYVGYTEEPNQTYACSSQIGSKDKYINLSVGWLKSKDQDWVSKHEAGHILAGHIQPYTHFSTEDFKSMGDWESTTREEIEATIAGYGGPSRVPTKNLLYMKEYVEDLGVPADQSWAVVKRIHRECGVPYRIIKKAEEQFGFKD